MRTVLRHSGPVELKIVETSEKTEYCNCDNSQRISEWDLSTSCREWVKENPLVHVLNPRGERPGGKERTRPGQLNLKLETEESSREKNHGTDEKTRTLQKDKNLDHYSTPCRLLIGTKILIVRT